jgi:hypothetical protein
MALLKTRNSCEPGFGIGRSCRTIRALAVWRTAARLDLGKDMSYYLTAICWLSDFEFEEIDAKNSRTSVSILDMLKCDYKQ